MRTLPNPEFYDPKHCVQASYCNTDRYALLTKAGVWAKRHGIKPTGSDKVKIHLLVIDDQVDFSFPEGALYVGGRSGQGAMKAHRALVEWVYKYLYLISEVTCTLDTHLPFQVFFPSAHLCEDGSFPEPGTIILAEEYRRGMYRPNPALARQVCKGDVVWLQKQFVHYCNELEKDAKYALMLWPYHCMVGSEGHRLAGVVDEARMFHAFVRGAANLPEIKGGNPLSERYSIFKEEVQTTWDGRQIPKVQKNVLLLETLMNADVVVLAGEAASHCVKESIHDLLTEIRAKDESLAKKVYIMKDCSASVVIPGGPDFTDQAETAYDEFASAGMNVVSSRDPIENWPGIRLP